MNPPQGASKILSFVCASPDFSLLSNIVLILMIPALNSLLLDIMGWCSLYVFNYISLSFELFRSLMYKPLKAFSDRIQLSSLYTCTSFPPHVRESRFRNLRNMFLWNPESRKILLMESGILGFRIRNTAEGIRNPTNDWNLESKFD